MSLTNPLDLIAALEKTASELETLAAQSEAEKIASEAQPINSPGEYVAGLVQGFGL